MHVLSSALLALTVLPSAGAQSFEDRPSLADRAAQLVADADQDGDGAITREEFDAARLQTFDRLDQNADGFLDEDERQPQRSATRVQRPSGPRAQAAIQAAQASWDMSARNPDANQDGLISQEEYLAAPAPGFDRIDQNADGVLSPDELAAAQERAARRPRRAP